METIDFRFKTINSSNSQYVSIHIVCCCSYSGTSWVIHANICVPPRVQRIFEWIINCGKLLIWNGSFIFPLRLLIITGHRSHSHGVALLFCKRTLRSAHRPNLVSTVQMWDEGAHADPGEQREHKAYEENSLTCHQECYFQVFIRICIQGKNFERCKWVSSSTSQDMVSQMWETVSVNIWNLTHEQ